MESLRKNIFKTLSGMILLLSIMGTAKAALNAKMPTSSIPTYAGKTTLDASVEPKYDDTQGGNQISQFTITFTRDIDWSGISVPPGGPHTITVTDPEDFVIRHCSDSNCSSTEDVERTIQVPYNLRSVVYLYPTKPLQSGFYFVVLKDTIKDVADNTLGIDRIYSYVLPEPGTVTNNPSSSPVTPVVKTFNPQSPNAPITPVGKTFNPQPANAPAVDDSSGDNPNEDHAPATQDKPPSMVVAENSQPVAADGKASDAVYVSGSGCSLSPTIPESAGVDALPLSLFFGFSLLSLIRKLRRN